MKKLWSFLFLVGVMMISHFAFAVCSDGRIGIEVRIGKTTSDRLAAEGGVAIPLGREDSIVVYEEYFAGEPGRKEVFPYGYVETDGAGNFSVKAVSFVYTPPIYIELDHDHETSFNEGMRGYYRNRKGQDFHLSSLRRCHWSDLLVFVP